MTTGAPVPRLLHPLIDQREGGVDGTTLAPLQQLISLPQEKESHQCRSSFKYLRPPNLMSLSNSTALQLPRLLLPHQIHCLSSAAGCRISAKAKEPPQIPLLQSQSASLPIAHRLELLRYDFTTGLDNRPVFFRTPMILRLPPSAFASFVPQEQSFSSKSSRNLKQSAPIMMREVSVQFEKLSGPEQQTALMEEGSHAKPQQPFAASIGPSVDKSIQCSSSEEQMAKEEQKTSLSDIKGYRLPSSIRVSQTQSLAPVAESAVSLNGADEAPLDLMLQNLLQETMSTTPVRTCVAPEPLGPSPVQLLTPQSSVFAPLTGPPPVSSPLFQFPPMCPKESIPPVAATATVGVSTSPEIQLGGLPTSNEPSQQPEQPEDYQMLESRLAAIDRVAEKIEQEYERNKEITTETINIWGKQCLIMLPVWAISVVLVGTILIRSLFWLLWLANRREHMHSGDANAQKSAEGHSVTPEEASHYDGPSSSPLPMEGALGEETKEDEGTAVPAGSLRLLKSVLEARNQSRLSSAPTSARFSSRLSATAPSKGRQSARRTTYTRDLTHQGPLRRELQYRLAERRRKEAKDYATKGFRDSATPNSSVFIDWDKIDELIESG
ncbi:unnamed protein product [Schistocephalus solidus]|uniref:Mitotic interactor and substrate of PLK1 n=1 Tax=Schistocephalus solidus TaxID=70667 RepID=A0A183SRE9_SCHSO|nr:unnamed protein product [Schistocephalus solidus]